MQILRWILLMPGALVAGMFGSLAGGASVASFGQIAADIGSAFGGPFAFVFAAGLIAPSRRRAVVILSFAVVAVLALGTVALSTFTTIEEFSRLPWEQRFVAPVAQVGGALAAFFSSFPFARVQAEVGAEPAAAADVRDE